MRDLIFDTETTGIAKSKFRSNPDKQPFLVQLAAIIVENGETKNTLSIIVDSGVPIPRGAFEAHGISNAEAERYGVRPEVAVAMFNNLLKKADRIVAHNTDFDMLVMRAAYQRAGKPLDSLYDLPRLCTMKSSTELINLPPTAKMVRAGYNKPKVPSLTEAHKFFFDEGFEGAHDALADVLACVRVFAELKSRGIELIAGDE